MRPNFWVVLIFLAVTSCVPNTSPTEKQTSIAVSIDKFEEVCLASIKMGRADGMGEIARSQNVDGWTTGSGWRRDEVLETTRPTLSIGNTKHGAVFTISEKHQEKGRESCGFSIAQVSLADMETAILSRLKALNLSIPVSRRHRDAFPEFPDEPYYLSLAEPVPRLGKRLGEIYVVWN